VVGIVLLAGAGVGVPALPVAVAFGEWRTALHIVITMIAMACVGGGTMVLVGRPDDLRPKDAFAGVALAWVSVIAFGSLPYLMSGSFGFTDAMFESTAGFTTTGATVITDLSSVTHGLMIWRATTQWLGGMGIIVLSIAVLPFVGAGGLHLARAEVPGPGPDRLTPRLRGTALQLWILYTVLTVAAGLALAAGDMTPFQAAAHALSTLSTGGFGTEQTSLAGFSAYSQWVVIVFMAIAGGSFTLHIRALRHPGLYATTPEARYYLLSLVAGAGLLAGGLSLEAAGIPIREAVFTGVATITGTGFAVTNYGAWPSALGGVLLMLMFLGGMGGSTTGALKTYRVAVALKSTASEVRRFTRPRTISITRFGRAPIPDAVVSTVHAYVVVYLLAFGIGTIALLYADAVWGAHMDLVSGLSAAASAIGNVGPGLGSVGPAGTYAAVSSPGKWVLGMLMILGRLEIYPVVLLFTASFWRK